MKDASLGYILLESFCAVFHKFLWKGHETAKVNTFSVDTSLWGCLYFRCWSVWPTFGSQPSGRWSGLIYPAEVLWIPRKYTLFGRRLSRFVECA